MASDKNLKSLIREDEEVAGKHQQVSFKGAKRRRAWSQNNVEDAKRQRVLFVLASRTKQAANLKKALSANTSLLLYSFESTTLDSLQAKISETLNGEKVRAVGFALDACNGVLQLTGQDNRAITERSLGKDKSPVNRFFRWLTESGVARLDFLGCLNVHNLNGLSLAIGSIGRKTVKVTMIRDFVGLDEVKSTDSINRTVGEIYFDMDRLANIGVFQAKMQPTTAGYEKIRLVGKGAFGAAILYRRKYDESLVILKEINMHELDGAQRQLALNEVNVLSQLDHANIISYYDCFEEDGILMIEMQYADGGTLAQFLASRERRLDEAEIVFMYEQIVNGVCYLHDNNVLHRDLKTANIFLTTDHLLKIGDFGISKVMGTDTQHQGAQTVIGTPYYISPEMCEGKTYNEKSDIWALGCILYEMACLQKTFEGSNLPALVNKIMKGEYDQVRGNYSSELKILIRDILRKEAELRPTARDILEKRLPRLTGRRDRNGHGHGALSVDSASIRSVLYSFDPSNMTIFPVSAFPQNIYITQVAVSGSHQISVSSEKVVYVWGENSCGQLGLGDRRSRSFPCIAHSLNAKSISKLACGEKFSLFCSENGIIMSCGEKSLTGNDDREDVLRPKLIDSLLSTDIVSISCGKEHAMVVDREGRAFVWGKGGEGRLGTGQERDVVGARLLDSCPRGLRAARCGHDCSFLLTDSGQLLATGSNRFNKLNLNHRQGFFSQAKAQAAMRVDKVSRATAMRSFGGERVVDVSAGRWHTAVLLESGRVQTFGRAAEGQLGREGQLQGVAPVKALAAVATLIVQCGRTFSLAATANNELYFWGSNRCLSVCLSDDQWQTAHKPTAVVHPFATNQLDQHSRVSSKTSDLSICTVQTKLSSSMEHLCSDLNNVGKGKRPSDGTYWLPKLILRLDSAVGSIKIGAISVHDDRALFTVDTSSLKSHPAVTRHSSAPPLLPSSLDNTLVASWLQRELKEAEVTPSLGRADRCSSGTPSSSKRPAPRKRRARTSLPAKSGQHQKKEDNKELLKEIDALKQQLSEQRDTCHGQALQMSQLQRKLKELEQKSTDRALVTSSNSTKKTTSICIIL